MYMNHICYKLAYLKERLGLAMVINPEYAAAEEIARVLLFPSAIKIEPFGKGRVEMITFRLPKGNFLVGQSVKDAMAKLKTKVLICTVERGEAAFIPSLFEGVFTGVESQRKKSLPLGDLNRLMTVPVKGEKLRKTQLALCLMFQYGGMSFVDFAHLNRGNIKNGILDYNRQKTGTSMRLEVLDTAEAMYKELAGERGGGSGYLFPFLSGTKNGHEEYLEYNAALSRFNRNLKTLKEVAGIASESFSATKGL